MRTVGRPGVGSVVLNILLMRRLQKCPSQEHYRGHRSRSRCCDGSSAVSEILLITCYARARQVEELGNVSVAQEEGCEVCP